MVDGQCFLALGLALTLSFAPQARAQFEQYNHPELIWKTIETDHFFTHYHEGSERTARELAGIAEQVYEPITSLYGYHPDGKVHWIVKDTDDYSNGGTYYYDNKIVIWATPLDFELRGTHHWLYDVVTHEFTHMIQLGASRKGPRWLPGVYFQYIGYEEERRPDVLYGFPNRIGSWPITSTQIPMWFAEGTAQFQVRGIGHDWWDSHRDMMIRVRALGGNLLTQSEMDVFGKSTLGSELVYCQGYALTRYIANTYGVQTLADLSHAMQGLGTWDFDQACKKVLGVDENNLYRDWRAHTKENYLDRTENIRSHLVDGDVVLDEGFGNLYPAFSPDGKQIAFISNKGKDFLSTSATYLYDIVKDTLVKTECPATSPLGWSPDGKYLVYARQGNPNWQGSHFDDLYLWNIDKKREIRLTKDARLAAPSFSPDGKNLVAIHNTDGSHNLVFVTLPPDSMLAINTDGFVLPFLEDSKDVSKRSVWKKLTDFKDGRQIFKPRFTPDGNGIIGSFSDLGTRDIFQYSLSEARWSSLHATEFDERDPVISGDERFLYYSSDKTGIFNIYRRDLITLKDDPLTNVTGGALMPTLSLDGALAFANFTEKGYGIRLLKEPKEIDPTYLSYKGGEIREDVVLSTPPRVSNPAFNYTTPFGKLFILPRVAWDYNKFKPGFYAYTNDFLEKLSLFGGVQMNQHGDRDAYGSLEYRVIKPTIYLEAYNIVRNKAESFDDPFVIVGEKLIDSLAVPIFGTYGVNYKFNLVEFDVGAKLPISDNIMANGVVRLSTYKSALKFDDGGDFTYTYLRGKSFILRLDGKFIDRSVANDIHPKGGWSGWLEYGRENNRFIEGFEIDADKLTLLEVYKPYNYDRVEGEIDYYHKLFGGLVINPKFSGGVLSKTVDPFFHLYAGGLMGLRGYSYYSLGGTVKALGRLALRFPIATGIDKDLGPFYLDRVHGAIFAEAGDAWRSSPSNAKLRKDVGMELRIKMFSWYGFPTDISLAGAYGLDKFTVRENDIVQEYGKEWRWYLTVLFDFL